MKITIPHKQTAIEAITHIKKMLHEHRAEIEKQATDLKEEWQENVLHFGFTAQGSHIEGTLTVRDREFELYAKLPLMLRIFEGRIEKMIKEQIANAGVN